MPSSATPSDTGAGLQSAWRHELLTRLGWALLVMGAFVVPYSASRGWDLPRLAALAVLPVCGALSSVFGSRVDLRLRALLLVAFRVRLPTKSASLRH